jgi:gluconokinase
MQGSDQRQRCAPATLASSFFSVYVHEIQAATAGFEATGGETLNGFRPFPIASSSGAWITMPHPESRMSAETQTKEPSVVIVMGVSGSGKSTIAAMLAIRLGWVYADGDWFHPRGNIEKMHSGKPLTDEDRWPWLREIAAWIDDTRQAGKHGVVACSALKRKYRDMLIGERSDVRLAYLKGEPALIAPRLALRTGHFMQASLLDRQFAALQEPGEDENPIAVSIEAEQHEIVQEIIAKLGISA